MWREGFQVGKCTHERVKAVDMVMVAHYNKLGRMRDGLLRKVEGQVAKLARHVSQRLESKKAKATGLFSSAPVIMVCIVFVPAVDARISSLIAPLITPRTTHAFPH